MDAPSFSTQNGFRVPSWAVAALTAMTTLIGIGILLGSKLEAQAQQNDNVNYRLCRIERALQVDPWISCPAPEFRSNAVPSR
jgi:hypothetical protein